MPYMKFLKGLRKNLKAVFMTLLLVLQYVEINPEDTRSER